MRGLIVASFSRVCEVHFNWRQLCEKQRFQFKVDITIGIKSMLPSAMLHHKMIPDRKVKTFSPYECKVLPMQTPTQIPEFANI